MIFYVEAKDAYNVIGSHHNDILEATVRAVELAYEYDLVRIFKDEEVKPIHTYVKGRLQ
jgi:hypothetical protein